MVSDTVPAAADGPNTPPGNAPTTAAGDQGATPSSGLAGLLAPVQVARPAAFNLDPTNTLPGDATTPDVAAAGITSATFHNTPAGAGNSSTETVTQRQQQSVLRAFALAMAERWRKGGDARLKALDVQKEKAKQNQVKTSATVNRSEKILGGSTHTGSSTNSNSGKSLDNKTRQHNSGNGGGTSNNGSGGRGGNSGGRGGNGGGRGHDGHSGGTGSSGGRGGAGRDKPSRRDGSGNSDGSRSSDSASRRRHDNNGTGSGTGGRENSGNGHGREHGGSGNSGSGTGTRTNNGGSGARGAQGPAGPTGGRGPSGDNTRTPRTQTENGRQNQQGQRSQPAGTERRPDGPQRVHRPGDSSGRPWRTSPDRPDRAGNQTADNQGRQQAPERTDTPRGRRTPDRADRDRRTQPAPPAQDKVSLEKKDPTTQTPDASTGTGRQDQNGQQRPQRPTDRPRTQGSRETGYRDGARAGAAANHVIAYRDGVRDGWNDQRAHGRREAEQLNQAHTDRRQQAPQPQPQPRPQPQEIPPMPTEPPTNGPAQPIQVTNANASHIELGNGAARQFVSRGEVRNLAGYQRALDRKSINMARVAEHTLIYERHASAQAQRAMKLLEQARTVKGGDKLLRTLTRLAEAARAQEIKAAQAHKRAQRANESCRVLYANVDTRYSEIFKAAVDSADGPAELAYYRDLGMEPTNG